MAAAEEADLSGHEHNYDDVRGEGFFGLTRRERRAYPSGVCEERATKSGRKRTAARRVAPNLACGLRCSSITDPLRDMLPPRALPQAKFGATNVIVVMFMTTKSQFNDQQTHSLRVTKVFG